MWPVLLTGWGGVDFCITFSPKSTAVALGLTVTAWRPDEDVNKSEPPLGGGGVVCPFGLMSVSYDRSVNGVYCRVIFTAISLSNVVLFQNNKYSWRLIALSDTALPANKIHRRARDACM